MCSFATKKYSQQSQGNQIALDIKGIWHQYYQYYQHQYYSASWHKLVINWDRSEVWERVKGGSRKTWELSSEWPRGPPRVGLEFVSQCPHQVWPHSTSHLKTMTIMAIPVMVFVDRNRKSLSSKTMTLMMMMMMMATMNTFQFRGWEKWTIMAMTFVTGFDTWNSLVVTIMTLNDDGDDGFLKCAMMTNWLLTGACHLRS